MLKHLLLTMLPRYFKLKLLFSLAFSELIKNKKIPYPGIEPGPPG